MTSEPISCGDVGAAVIVQHVDMEFAGMRPDKTSGSARLGAPDNLLWQKCRVTEAPQDEAEQFLDLAAYAEGRLDEDDRERIVARVAADAWLAADLAVAQTAAARHDPAPAS